MSANPRRIYGSITEEYSYLFADKVGSITHGSESFSFTYDGTLLTSITQSGLLNHTINYTYNNDFKVTSSTYAGVTENYSYDNDGLLTGSGDYTLIRDAQNGYVTQLSDGTLTQKRVYNDYGELNRLDDGTIAYQLHRDNTKIISKTEFVTKYEEVTNGKGKSKNPPKTKLKKVKEKVTYDYKFDERDRLVEVYKDRALVEKYTYDANGNRASATINGVTTTASYTLDDQLEVYGDNTYRYDDDGYLSEKTTPEGTTTYTYGTMGELKEVSTPTQTITYQHNALNQRVAKLINGQVVEKYLWANLTTLLAVYDKDDNLVQRFEYADGRMPVSMTTADNTKYYLHYDQVGSLRAVSDADGQVIKEISYDTYGNILSDSNPDFKMPFGFAGGLYDSETKLTRFGYRDYDAYTGKWTAKDPIGFDGGDTNLYGYVLGDPVNFVDVNGLYGMNRNGGHGHNRSGSGYATGGFAGGYGANIHLGIAGMSYYEFYSSTNKTTVQCFRAGPGIFLGGGAQGMESADYPSDDCQTGCTETWSVGLGGAIPTADDGATGGSIGFGPSGMSLSHDVPFLSPGAGLYGGVEVCKITVCPR